MPTDILNIDKTRLPKDIRNILKQQKVVDIDNFHLKLNKAAYFEDEKKFREQIETLPWEKRKFMFAKYKRNVNESEVIQANFGKFNEAQTLSQLAETQYSLAKNLCGESNVVRLTMTLDWRLSLGLGQESVYETALTLHHIYGIPYIPASSLKGVLRSYMVQKGYACEEVSATSNIEAIAFNRDKVLCDIFGCAEEYHTLPSFYKANSFYGIKEKQGDILFFDAFPTSAPKVEPDVMNPHYPDYYMRDKLPTDHQSPIPIMFLTVKDASFQFIIGLKCKKEEDKNVINGKFGSGSLLDITKTYLTNALTKHGIGAKTSVGYGLFSNTENKAPTQQEETKEIAVPKQDKSQPQFLQKDPKANDIIHAEIIAEGNTNNIKLFLKADETAILSLRYGSGFSKDKIGKIIKVKATNILKGKVQSVQFLSYLD